MPFGALVAGLGKAAGWIGANVGAKSVLGSALRTGLGSVAGGFVDRGFDSLARRDQYDFLASKGLTATEIAGSGFGDGRGSSASNVLGNQMLQVEQQQRQQAYEQAERDKDRAIAMRGQDASLQAAKLSSGASIYSSDMSGRIAEMNNALARDQFENIALPDALRRAVTESPSWKRLQILAGMGVDNMIGTAIGNKYGLDPMDPDALGDMTPSEFRRMVTEIYGLQSNVFGETAGAATVIDHGVSEAVDGVRSVLGGGAR